jgi:hypothetical protein
VLQNWKKHVPGAHGPDSRSSAAWFPDWRVTIASTPGPAPIAAARTWLARVGWQKHGSIDISEMPRRSLARRRR